MKIIKSLISVSLLVSIFIPITTNAAPTDHFVIEVTITDEGDTTFTIPTFSGETYNYDVDWDNDQTFEDAGNTGDATYDLGSTGTYTIRITGTFPRIYFNNAGDKAKITDVLQWGTNTWTSMANAFYGCTNLEVTATDTPDLSSVTNMSGMFRNADSLAQDIGDWDVSGVTDISYMFAEAGGLQDNVGTFNSEVEYSGPDGAQATNAGDLNNDGYPDFIMNGTGFKVYLNDGDGTFTLNATYSDINYNVRDADLGDINNDGYLDYIRILGNAVGVFYNNGDGTFASPVSIADAGANTGTTVGDLNGDGTLDIVNAHWAGTANDTVAVILNNGDGTFETPVLYSLSSLGPRKISIADFDDDGYNDLAVTIDGAPGVHVFLNDGDGTFAVYVIYSLPGWGGYSTDTDVGDLDQDGDIDIAGTSHGNCQYFGTFLNDGDGTFSNGSNIDMDCRAPDDVEVGDLNGDGYPDAVVGQVNSNGVSVFLNDGTGSFSGFTDYSVGGDVQVLDLADFDQDGGLDIVAPDANNDKASVFLNKSLGLNNWDTSSVTDMSYMFYNASTFNQNLSAWSVKSSADTTDMFSGATAFNPDFDNWSIIYPSGGSSHQTSATSLPSKPTIYISDLSSKSLRINSSYKGDNTLTQELGITYKEEGNNNEQKTVKVSQNTYGISSFTHTLQNLECNTTYILKTYAKNSKGTTYSDEEEITTKACDTTTEEETTDDTTSEEVTFYFTNELEYGQTNDKVKELQKLLNIFGFTVSTEGPGSLNNETNYYGEKTRQAVIKLQQALGITPSNGRVGPQTMSIFNLLKVILDLGLR